MYSEKLENLIDDIIADGSIEESEMLVLKKAAIKEGEDPDELEVVVKGRLAKMQKKEGVFSPTPQSNKFGGPVAKCPNCGEPHIAGQAACPACGYAFSGIQATSSSEKLYNQLLEFNSKNKLTDKTQSKNVGQQAFASFMSMTIPGFGGEMEFAKAKMDVIKDFPVPNAREDLIDFLTSIQPKANPKGPRNGSKVGYANTIKEDLSYAYWLLYANCINKAQVSFHSDPDFQRFFSWYEEQKTNAETTIFGKIFGKKK